jgi:glutaconate CoA-transferase subunit A
MTEKEAVEKFIPDGCYLGIGGFGANRIPTAVIHEILRARRKNLGFLGHTSTHDFELLCAGKCFNRLDAAYVVGLEARGLSPNARRYMESGEVKVTEWTNYSLAARLRAAAEGVSFFRGISVADLELSRAAKHLIITAERLVTNFTIRNNPTATSIPFYLVDAVVEVPYGSYPGNMPYLYFSDEEHLAQWMKVEKDPKEFEKFLDHYIYGVSCFEEYLERCGGLKKLKELQKLETLVEK